TDAGRPRTVRIVGKHCESGDVLVSNARVPDDIAVGDILCTPVTGA
ncbi:MAG TPA: diaminopimelate decarboxylase, partial [Acidimicrobiales bacterium]|nr:diaminopimelate decarboxylase [Acidimicrobiales bacterium]